MRALPTRSTGDVRAYAGGNSLKNHGLSHFAAIKPQCPGDSSVTGLFLLDLTDYDGSEPYQYKNGSIRALEDCIYSHSSRFGQMVSQLFNRNVFFGFCAFVPEKGHKTATSACFANKVSDGFGRAQGGTEDVCMNAVLGAIHNQGNISYSRVTRWFDSFGDAMTNRCRSEFGAAVFDSSNPTLAYEEINSEIYGGGAVLPPGRVVGTTWQTKNMCLYARVVAPATKLPYHHRQPSGRLDNRHKLATSIYPTSLER